MAEPLEQQEFLTERNLGLLRAAYEAVGKGDIDSVEGWDLISDDIVIRDRPEAPDPQTYRGRTGMREALESSDESFEEFSVTPIDLIGIGDTHAVVVLRMFGRGRGSGVPVEEEIAHLWTFENGKAVAMQGYSDPQDALRDGRASAASTE
jgi:ketosteroid isomerase-like protein